MVTITLCVHSLPILYSFFVIASSSSFSSSSCVVEPYIGSTWSPSSSSSLSGYRFSRVEILLFLIYWVSSSLHSLQHIYLFRCLRYLLFLFPFLSYQWSMVTLLQRRNQTLSPALFQMTAVSSLLDQLFISTL